MSKDASLRAEKNIQTNKYCNFFDYFVSKDSNNNNGSNNCCLSSSSSNNNNLCP